MDFMKLAAERYSVRKFDERPVEQEKIDIILEAAKLAPTAHNNQPQKIFVLKSDEAKEKIKKCTQCHFNAPLYFLICYDKDLQWKRDYDGMVSGDIDTGIVGTHMMMAAWELGIGSCWVAFFDPAAVVKEFNLPENLIPATLFPMGYAAESAHPAKLHDIFRDDSELVEYM
ncbi:MAG: nitroreductase family protein [Parasporobacterium sp.]|nr:nitroreductase family protein [Parasporobacterium sp.]